MFADHGAHKYCRRHIFMAYKSMHFSDAQHLIARVCMNARAYACTCTHTETHASTYADRDGRGTSVMDREILPAMERYVTMGPSVSPTHCLSVTELFRMKNLSHPTQQPALEYPMQGLTWLEDSHYEFSNCNNHSDRNILYSAVVRKTTITHCSVDTSMKLRRQH